MHDREQELFARLENDKRNSVIGPKFQPWELTYIIVQTIANLPSFPENPKWYMNNPRIRDPIMPIYMFVPGLGDSTPQSKFLKPRHLRIRKAALSLIGNPGPGLNLLRNPAWTIKRLQVLLIAASIVNNDL